MSLLRSLFPRRVLTPNQIFGTDAQWWESGVAGVRVDQTTAITLAAVWSAVRLLSQDIATLPFNAIAKVGDTRQKVDPQPTWINEPIPSDPNQTGVDYLSQVCVSLLLDGNAFVLVLPDVFRPFELRVLNPRLVEIKQSGSTITYIVRGDRGQIVNDNLTALQVLHIPWVRRPGALRGMSPIEVQEQTIGRGLAAQEVSARFFGQGSIYGGIVEYPESVDVSDEDIKKMLAGLNKRHRGQRNAWALGALTGGAKLHEVMAKPADSQLLETEKWIRDQVNQAYGIPPFLGGSSEPGAVSYASTEQQGILYKQSAVAPITTRLQEAHTRLLPPGEEMRFNLNGLLRGDSKARAEFYREGINAGWMVRSEPRTLEDMDPIDGLDTPLAQLNLAPVGAIEEQTHKVKVEIAMKLVQYGADWASALASVGLPPIEHTGVLPVTVQQTEREEAMARMEVMPSASNGDTPALSVHLPDTFGLGMEDVKRQLRATSDAIAERVQQQIDEGLETLNESVAELERDLKAELSKPPKRVSRKVVRDADRRIISIVDE